MARYKKPDNFSEVRRAAWKTRRAKYGPTGHDGSYSRPVTRCGACQSMMDLIIKLHADGTLSEGQAAKATGLDRVELRRRVDAGCG